MICVVQFRILFSYLIEKQSFRDVWREVQRFARVNRVQAIEERADAAGLCPGKVD